MVNIYYQKHKERLPKDACERNQNVSEEEKNNRRKEIENQIKILLIKKKKGFSIIRNVSRSYLSIEEIII